jgi:plasmid stability protein
MLERMPTMVQIRNVPDDLHRQLKARAALAGMSLSDFLLSELRRSLERPTRQELMERIAKRSPVKVRPSAAQAVRSERERR